MNGRIWSVAVAAVLMAGMVASSPLRAQTTLAVSSWVGPTHLVTTDLLGGWMREVEKASNGRIKSRLLPKAVTAPPGTLDAIRDGLADVSIILHGMQPARFVLTKAAEFPGLGTTGEINSAAYQRIHDKHFAKVDEHKGVRVLAVFTHGPGNILTIKKPVQRLEDVAGLKFRVGGGFLGDLLTSLGAVPIVRSGSESYELLSGGIVDATALPYESIVAFNLDRIIRHLTVVPGGLYNLTWAVIMNEDKFRSLSKQDQEVIVAWSGERLARHSGRAWDNKDRQAYESVRKGPIQSITADQKFVDNLRERAKVFEDAWIKEAGQKGVDGALVMRELRAEIARVTAAR